MKAKQQSSGGELKNDDDNSLYGYFSTQKNHASR